MVKKLLVGAFVVAMASQNAVCLESDTSSVGDINAAVTQIEQEVKAAMLAGATQEEVVGVVADLVPTSALSEKNKTQIIGVVLGMILGVTGCELYHWFMNGGATPPPGGPAVLTPVATA